MAKQNLTPTAKRMKAARDKRAAMTPNRRKKKAENQRKRRSAIKHGKNARELINTINFIFERKF